MQSFAVAPQHRTREIGGDKERHEQNKLIRQRHPSLDLIFEGLNAAHVKPSWVFGARTDCIWTKGGTRVDILIGSDLSVTRQPYPKAYPAFVMIPFLIVLVSPDLF